MRPLVWVLLAGALRAAADPLFQDDFDGPGLSPGWEVDVSAGNSIAVRDGRLRVRARLNTFAHVQRPLGADLVTVTALLQPSVPSGVSWACGVFLYWSEGAWVQGAVTDSQGGQYYAAEASSGPPRETCLAPCDRARPQWLRVELGRDVVRWLTRTAETEDWTLRRAVRRLPAWEGAPRLLILGKGYGREEAPYGRPDLDNDYPPDAGPEVEAWFERVAVEPTPPERVPAGPGEIPPRHDVDGERLLALPGDPDYEAVAAVYPPMRHVREAVGVKWHRQEVGVSETGALELRSPADREGPMSLAGTLHLGPEGTAFGSGPARPVKRLLEGWMPVVTASWPLGGVAYEMTVLGYSEGLSDRAPPFACVRLVASGAPGRIPVAFRVTPEAAGCAPLTGELAIPAGGSAVWAFRVPATVRPGDRVEPLTAADFEAALEAVRAFWGEDLRRGLQLEVPDPRLMQACRAWLCYNAIDVDRVGDALEAHDGSGFYEEGYGYSAARYAWALDLFSRHDEAAAVLDGLRRQQRPDGSLDWNFGLTDTGAYLMAAAAHFALSGDADWLRGTAPSLIAACDYVARRRTESRGEGPLTAGLIRHRSYCDYPPPVYGYLHNAYCCAGMERTAGVLRAVGLDAEAERIGAEAAAFRRDIEHSMRAALMHRDGLAVLPLEPDTHRLLRDVGYDSRDYYSLVGSMLLESGFLAPESPEAEALAGFLRAAGGIQMGVCEFQGGIDHAYSFGYLLHCLRRGEPERYLLGLQTSLAYGMTRETFSSVECTQHKTGTNALTLPHLYSGTQQLFLVRTLLLREEGQRLILCSATPRQWLAGGRHIAVSGAATPWGPVSFRVESLEEGRVLQATVSRPARGAPQEVELSLRRPGGGGVLEATLNGRPWEGHSGEVFRIPGGELPCRLQVRYAP